MLRKLGNLIFIYFFILTNKKVLIIFQNVLLDGDENITKEQARIYSCIRFVADKCVPVCFYFNEDQYNAYLLKELGVDVTDINHELKALLKSLKFSDHVLSGTYNRDMPKIVYMSYEDWNMCDTEDDGLPVKEIKNEFVLSDSDYVNKTALEQQGLNSNTAILCLAALGLDIMLPNISFNLIAEEEIEKIRETLHEERINYVNSITSIADESYERIASGDLKDIIIWAQNEVSFKLVPKARIIEEEIPKIQKETLKKAGYEFWKEGVPAIGKGYINGGLLAASKITLEELIKLFTYVLGQEVEKRNLPEVAYAYKISRMNLNQKTRPPKHR